MCQQTIKTVEVSANTSEAMGDTVAVNGATMDRAFFLANLDEARGCSWAPATLRDDHKHCIVCTVAIRQGEAALNDSHRWLCGYCHEQFLVQGRIP